MKTLTLEQRALRLFTPVHDGKLSSFGEYRETGMTKPSLRFVNTHWRPTRDEAENLRQSLVAAKVAELRTEQQDKIKEFYTPT